MFLQNGDPELGGPPNKKVEVVKCGHKGFVARPEPETTTQEVSPETRLRHLVEFFLEEGWVFEDKLKQLRKQLPSRDFDDRLQQWLGEAYLTVRLLGPLGGATPTLGSRHPPNSTPPARGGGAARGAP